MKMWICRDEDGLLHIEFTDKPPFKSIYERTVVWASNSEWGSIELDRTSFPEVTFENSPKEVELVLPSQEPTIGDLLNQLMELNKEYKEFRMLVGLMRHAQTYGDKQSSFQESAVDHFIKTHNIDWD